MVTDYAVATLGWVLIGIPFSAFCAWGLARRKRWAYVATSIYAITAAVSLIGLPYAAFAAHNLRRPAVRAALGRKPLRDAPAAASRGAR